MSLDTTFNAAQKPAPGELIEAAKKKEDPETIKAVKTLLLRGAEINEKDAQGNTALISAARMGNTEVVRLLIAANADLNLMNNRGHTALSTAVRTGSVDVMNLLIDNNADVNTKTIARQRTALMAGIIPGWHAVITPEVVQTLASNGAVLDEKDKVGRTALMWAAYFNQTEIMPVLMSNGASIDELDDEGHSALDLAQQNNSHDAIVMLEGIFDLRQRQAEEKARAEAAEKERVRHETVAEKQQNIKKNAPKLKLKAAPSP